MARRAMQFGIFLAPFHRRGDNPTLAIARGIEMIELLGRVAPENLGARASGARDA